MTLRLLFVGCMLLAACARSSEQNAVRAAEGFLKEGQLQAAMETVEGNLKQFPSSPDLLRLRVMIFLKAEQLDLAYAALQQLPAGDPVLAHALHRSDAAIRSTAAKLIADRSLPIALRELVRGLDDPLPTVRRYCARALGQRHANEAVRPLFRLLHDDNWFVRAEAASALSEINDPHAAGWLIRLLDDGDGFVRYSAATALRRVACEANRDLLTGALRRASQRAQFSIAAALAKLRDPLAVGPLTNAVASNDAEVRRRAAESLGDLASGGGAAAAVAAATNALARLIEDADVSVRDHARLSLEKFKSGRIVAP